MTWIELGDKVPLNKLPSHSGTLLPKVLEKECNIILSPLNQVHHMVWWTRRETVLFNPRRYYMSHSDDSQVSANLLCLIAGASTEINRSETADEVIVVLEHFGLQQEQVPKVREHLLSALMHLSEIDSLMRS